MLRQVLRRARRPVRREVGRAGADHATIWGELAGGERGVPQVRDADGKIESFVHDVDVAVRKAERELHLRITRGERGDERR